MPPPQRSLSHLQSLFQVEDAQTAEAQDAGPSRPCPSCPSPPAGSSLHGGSLHGSSQAGGSQHGGMQALSSLASLQPGPGLGRRQLTKAATFAAGSTRLQRTSSRVDPNLLARHSLTRQHSLGSEGPPQPPPRPTLQYNGRLHALLLKRCAEATQVLERVQRPQAAPEAGGERRPPLSKPALRIAEVGRVCG